MAAFNALGTWGAIFLLHQFRGLQVSFGLQGSREPRHLAVANPFPHVRFQSTRLSRASTRTQAIAPPVKEFQSTRLSRALTPIFAQMDLSVQFQSTRLSRASTANPPTYFSGYEFQSTRLSRASTKQDQEDRDTIEISIHKALASLDVWPAGFAAWY